MKCRSKFNMSKGLRVPGFVVLCWCLERRCKVVKQLELTCYQVFVKPTYNSCHFCVNDPKDALSS